MYGVWRHYARWEEYKHFLTEMFSDYKELTVNKEMDKRFYNFSVVYNQQGHKTNTFLNE